MNTITKNQAAEFILNSHFNVNRPSVETVFAKYIARVYAEGKNIFTFLTEVKEKLDKNKRNEFNTYYGIKGFNYHKNDIDSLIDEKESYADFILRCAEILGDDDFEYLSKVAKKYCSKLVWNNFEILNEHAINFVFTDFDSDFRGKIVRVHYFGGIDSSLKQHIIIQTKREGETNFYFIEETQYGPRLNSAVFDTYQSIVCYLLSPTFYSSILKLIQ